MIKTEEQLIFLISEGQSGMYDKSASIIRNITGKIQTVLKLKNPLTAAIFIGDIEMLLQVMNPLLKKEIKWITEVKKAMKLWHNDIVISNRILGIKNDNEYDSTVFEKLIMEKFGLKKKPNKDAIIKTDFETMISLIELGVRRF